jgi:hypothetical protein
MTALYRSNTHHRLAAVTRARGHIAFRRGHLVQRRSKTVAACGCRCPRDRHHRHGRRHVVSHQGHTATTHNHTTVGGLAYEIQAHQGLECAPAGAALHGHARRDVENAEFVRLSAGSRRSRCRSERTRGGASCVGPHGNGRDREAAYVAQCPTAESHATDCEDRRGAVARYS